MVYNMISCKKSPETLKRLLILLCNLGFRAQKLPKIAHKTDLLIAIFGMAYIGQYQVNTHYSCPAGSEYVWQRGSGLFKAKLRVAAMFKKKLTQSSLNKKPARP